jgi:hypothetical protein
METQEGIYLALNLSGDKVITVLTIIMLSSFGKKGFKSLKKTFRPVLNFLISIIF